MTIEEMQEAIRRHHYCQEMLVLREGEALKVSVQRVSHSIAGRQVVDGLEHQLSPQVRARILDLVAGELARQVDEAKRTLTDMGVTLS